MVRVILLALLCSSLLQAEQGAPSAPAAAPASSPPTSMAPADPGPVSPSAETPHAAPQPRAEEVLGDQAKPKDAKGAGDAGGWGLIIWILPLLLIFMLWSSTRTQKREKQRKEELAANAKIGSKVVTIGGVHGEVVRKGESTVDIRTGGANGPVITFSVQAISQVLLGDEKPGKDKA